jgi:hypothetical protein
MDHPGGAPERSHQDRIERWFVAQGVPRLVEGYSVEAWFPILASLVFVVFAYQVTAAPVLGPDPEQLVVAPAIVIMLALPAVPVLRALLDPGKLRDNLTRRQIALRLAPLAPVVVFALLMALIDPWANFAVLLVALFASAILVQPDIRTAAELETRRRRLSLVVVVGVVAFALEGLPLEPAGVEELGALPAPGSDSLSALPCLLLILFLSLRLSRASGAAEADGRAAVKPTPLFDAAPVLVLILGLETAVLPGTVPPWLAAAAPLVLLPIVVAAFSVAGLRRRLRMASTCRDSAAAILKERSIPIPALALFGGLYLFVYPILVWKSAGLETAALALAVNAVYLVVAWSVGFYGLDRVAAWATKEVVRNLGGVIEGLVRGLPLLLVFTAFLIMTSEVWQAVEGMETRSYLLLLGSLLALTGMFLLMASLREIRAHSEFKTWKDVREAAQRREADYDKTRGEVVPEITELLEEAGEVTGSTTPPELELSRSQRINALAVVAAYQGLVFIPLTAAAFGFFWWLGDLAVTDELLGNWVQGDDTKRADLRSFQEESFFAEPWTRVAALLAIFSLLFFAGNVLSNTELRRAFFAGADAALRQRFAVRIIYRDHYFEAGSRKRSRAGRSAWQSMLGRLSRELGGRIGHGHARTFHTP